MVLTHIECPKIIPGLKQFGQELFGLSDKNTVNKSKKACSMTGSMIFLKNKADPYQINWVRQSEPVANINSIRRFSQTFHNE